MPERFSAFSSRLRVSREFVSRYEVGIGSGLTIASVIYLPALNKALGIGNDLNAITMTEVGLVGLSASFFAAAFRNREKPSDFIRDVITIAKSSLRGTK